jgi:hypothetical protein
MAGQRVGEELAPEITGSADILPPGVKSDLKPGALLSVEQIVGEELSQEIYGSTSI